MGIDHFIGMPPNISVWVKMEANIYDHFLYKESLGFSNIVIF